MKKPLTEEEQTQQKMLFTALTDLFEVAYREYRLYDNREHKNPEVARMYSDEWAGWEMYIQKFMKRPAYAAVWREIKDEYDDGL